MKHPLRNLIISGIFLALIIWASSTFISPEEIVPAGIGALVRINQPLDTMEKFTTSSFVRELARTPGMESLAGVISNWESLKTHDFLLTALRLSVKDMYITVPSDLSRYKSNQMPFTTYVDLGLVGRMFSFSASMGLFGGKNAVSRHRDYLIFRKGSQSLAFVRNMIILGNHSAVIVAIDSLYGSKASISDNPQRFNESMKLADPNADVSGLILSRSMLRPAETGDGGFDPRILLSASAVEAAGFNAFIEDERITFSLEIKPVAGKTISPYTLDQPQTYKSLALPDAGTLFFAAVRLENPASMSSLLLDSLSGGDKMKSLRKKMASLVLSSFLENAGTDLALAIDKDTPEMFPTMVFQVKDKDKVRDFFAKMDKAESAKSNLLDSTVGSMGRRLIDFLADKPDQESLDEVLKMLPGEQHSQVNVLARILRDGLMTPEQIEQDTQHLPLFGRELYWRIAEDSLILAPSPLLANRYATNMQAGKAYSRFTDEANFLPINGPLLVAVDLTQLLDRLPEAIIPIVPLITEKQPYLMIGAESNSDRLRLAAQLHLPLGVASMKAEPSWLWMAVYYLLWGLLGIFALWLVYIFIRSAYLLRFGK